MPRRGRYRSVTPHHLRPSAAPVAVCRHEQGQCGERDRHQRNVGEFQPGFQLLDIAIQVVFNGAQLLAGAPDFSLRLGNRRALLSR